jgi:hypothetical protein
MVEGFLVDNVKAEFKPWLYNTGIPCLDELAGQWTDVRTLACYPTIGNFKGSVKVSKSFGGIDTEFFTGTKLPGTTGMFKSGETVIFNDQIRWFPYQMITRASFNGVELTATLRLVFEGSSLLMKVEIVNPTKYSAAFPLAMTLVPGIFNASTDRDPAAPVILYKDTYFAYSFLGVPDKIDTTSGGMEAAWDLHLSPGETREISYVMTIGNNYDAAITDASMLISNFQGAFIEAKNAWNARWDAVFTPGNEHYSGALPVFETSDRNLYELYYLSVASFLQNQQNNVYPKMPKAFGSNNEWARNQAYFWEISQVADIYALLDPAGLRQLLRMCLSVDINKGNAIDYSTGAIVNHWYAVNDYAVFKTIDAYVRINRDFDFLTEEVTGKAVMDHMFSLATAWEERCNRLFGLADYGSEPWSFFETNPDYIHMVPAMNAQNVWMMRSMAKYEMLYGSEQIANVLLEKADRLASNVKDLYVPGEGVWKIKYPDGSTIVSRHSYDFLTLGTTMSNDLGSRMKEEMLRFVEDELLEAHYMRAMSPKDQAALNSDRSDHGPAGSYIGWPALTVQAMADMGALCKASETLADFRLAFVEAGMGQAIEFLVPVGSTSLITRTGARAGASFLLSAANYANTIIDGLMGYDPGIDGNIEPSFPGKPRCFDGRLSHLRHGNDLYTIFAHSGGIKMINENRKD